MKGFIALPVTLLVLMFSLSFSKDTTVVLQNGLGQYDGCEDSYVYNKSYSPYGSSERLEPRYENC